MRRQLFWGLSLLVSLVMANIACSGDEERQPLYFYLDAGVDTNIVDDNLNGYASSLTMVVLPYFSDVNDDPASGATVTLKLLVDGVQEGEQEVNVGTDGQGSPVSFDLDAADLGLSALRTVNIEVRLFYQGDEQTSLSTSRGLETVAEDNTFGYVFKGPVTLSAPVDLSGDGFISEVTATFDVDVTVAATREMIARASIEFGSNQSVSVLSESFEIVGDAQDPIQIVVPTTSAVDRTLATVVVYLCEASAGSCGSGSYAAYQYAGENIYIESPAHDAREYLMGTVTEVDTIDVDLDDYAKERTFNVVIHNNGAESINQSLFLEYRAAGSSDAWQYLAVPGNSGMQAQSSGLQRSFNITVAPELAQGAYDIRVWVVEFVSQRPQGASDSAIYVPEGTTDYHVEPMAVFDDSSVDTSLVFFEGVLFETAAEDTP